ncbi:MAG: 4-alpha-glucanotransferase [Planctomycetota bacterium]|nr:4-alpha-glucanotransferase [Planctomycetota bacterium]
MARESYHSLPRSCGVLLHPTSLPGPYGVGDLGAPAREFVDFLAAAGQTWWQMLPVVPQGKSGSPYKSPSAFAGNPLLLSLEDLADEGLLSRGEIKPARGLDPKRVQYSAAWRLKKTRLLSALERFDGDASKEERRAFADFCRNEKAWLTSFALFRALSDARKTTTWTKWPTALRHRRNPQLGRARKRLAPAIRAEMFFQFVFFRQWRRLRAYARGRGVRLMGDLPIFVAHESADVWARRGLFKLDASGRPTVVAGVPPDKFSRTGQLWGHPHYRWNVLRRRGYDWWIDRLEMAFRLFDAVRLDHFLGFLRAWEVPERARTAREGQWAPGPGEELFRAARNRLGNRPLVAENLGLVTAAAEDLRMRFGMPGMRILQFELEDAGAVDAGDNVIYTGTHDNDTALGWYRALTPPAKRRVRHLLGTRAGDLHWSMIEAAYASQARIAIVPVQDILGLGGAARMNRPGVARGNWAWRLRTGALKKKLASRLLRLAQAYYR